MIPGPRYLMSPPEFYWVHYLLNPWMEWHERADGIRARRQWTRLVEVIEEAGGEVAVLPASPSVGAMTFTRDTAVVLDEGRALVLRNHSRRGRVEPAHVARWLTEDGFETEHLPAEELLDGGNVLRTADRWLIGVPPGTTRRPPDLAADLLRATTDVPCFGIPLVGGEFGHLDMVMADLAGEAWLVYPPALRHTRFDADEWRRVLGGRPVINVEDEEARELACNIVVVEDVVIGGGLSTRLCRKIERLGLSVCPVDLDEFRRGGGGAHCLTLELWPLGSKGWEGEQRCETVA